MRSRSRLAGGSARRVPGPRPRRGRGRDPPSIEKDGPTAMMSWLPENVSTYGKELDGLFHLIYYITGAAFVLVTVLLVAFLVMYRDRPGRRARLHPRQHDPRDRVDDRALADPGRPHVPQPSRAGRRSRCHVPESDLARPGHGEAVQLGGRLSRGRTASSTPPTTRRSTTRCTCRGQARSCVHLRAQGRDPQLLRSRSSRFKQDAVPGREIVQWFEATKPGKYEIPCAELCGFGHSGMKG